MVHDRSAEKKLKIAEHVSDEESKENEAGYRHDGLLPDRGFVESRHFHQLRIRDYGTHDDCYLSSGCALSRLALRVFWLRAIALALRVRPEGLGKQNILTENEPGDL